MRTSFLGRLCLMPSRYDPEVRAKAVRLVLDHRGDYPSEWAAIKAVSSWLGMNAETLRNWIRQQQVDDGQRECVSSEAAAEIRALKRRNAELERTIEILKAGVHPCRLAVPARPAAHLQRRRADHRRLRRLVQPTAPHAPPRPHPTRRSRGSLLCPTRDRPTGRITERRGCMKPGTLQVCRGLLTG